ncbi:MAG: ABC transporter permease [Halobacteriovoraceae bacterium]|nr:ABC transporter permease [Halobacteriovoraceae bacterium]
MLYLSFKQLFSKKKQTFFIILGIGFGAMLFIAISGVMLGLRSYIVSALLNNTAHILISGSERQIDSEDIKERFFGDDLVHWVSSPYGKRGEAKLENYQGWAERLNNHNDVFAFSPRLTINSMFSKRKIRTNVSLTGVIPHRQMSVSNIEDYMVEGHFEDLSKGGNKIIIGEKVGQDLGVKVGQTLGVLSRMNEVTMFKIVGVFRFGDERIDGSLAFALLTEVQKLNKTPGRVSEIAVALNDMEKSESLASFWSLYSSDKIQGWKNANKMFMEVIKMQDVVRYFIMFSVLVVAAFGVYNVLSIMINQKRKEIAILRSIGYSPSEILHLILYQGIFLGLCGGLLGLAFGVTLVTVVSKIDIGLQIGKSNHLIVSYDHSIYVTAFIAAVIASIFASIVPALSASKMTPIDIIRGE